MNYKSLFSSSDATLSQRVVRGSLWVFGLRITERIFGLIRTIILARLLAPEDFGLFGIAMLTMGILETFSQFGITSALVQKKENTEDYLDTAWTIQVIRALVLAFILFIIAPYIASFFNTPKVTSIIYVLAAFTWLGGLGNMGVVFFRKELEFQRQFFLVFIPMVFDIGISITAAVLLRNAWALVFGWIAKYFVWVIISYFMHPYRPHFRFEKEKAGNLLNYGKWIFGSSILVFFITHGDDIFLGKLLGATALGLYQMSYRIAGLPATEITHTVSEITFPAYSKLQDKLSQLQNGYLKTLQLVSFISVPIGGGIFFLAPDFVQLFLGEKWISTIPALQVLAIWGIVHSIFETTPPLFNGVGLPKINTYFDIAKLIILGIFIYPLTIKWGIVGTSFAVLLSTLIVLSFVFYKVTKVIQCSIQPLIKLISLPLMGTTVMLGSLSLLKYLIIDSINLISFIALIFAGILIYWGMTYLFDRFGNYGINPLIRKQFSLLMGR